MICPNCGSDITDNSNFCTYCGTSLHFPETPAPSGNVAGRAIYRLNFEKLLSDTVELYKRHFGTMCLVGLFLFGIPVVFAIGTQMSQFAVQITLMAKGPAILVVMFILLWIFMHLFQTLTQWYLMLWAIRQCLYIARGGVGFQTDMMFPPPMMFLKMVGVMFLIACINLICLFPALITLELAMLMNFQDASGVAVVLYAATVLFGIVGMCVSIWFSVRLYLAEIFIADRNAEIIVSLKSSWQVTSGNFWMLFMSGIVLGICSISGIILLGVGIILTAAVASLGGTLIYLQLTGQPNCLDYPIRQQIEAVQQETNE